MLLIPTLVHLELINTTPSIQDRKIIENEKRCRNGVPKSTQTRKDIKAGPAAMVRPVMAVPVFEGEKWCRLDSITRAL